MRPPSNRRRALLAVVGVALGAALLTAVVTLSTTMQEAVLQQVQRELGDWDIGVAVPDYGVDDGTHLPEETVAYIRDLPGVAYVVPQATFVSGSIETPVQYYVSLGTFPDSPEGSLMSFVDALRPGETLLPEPLARQLGVSVGDAVTLPFADRERAVVVAGVLSEVQTGSMPSAYFPYEWFADVLNLAGPPMVLVGLNRGASKTEVVAAIQFQYPDLVFDIRKSIDEMRWRLEGLSGVALMVAVTALLAGAVLALTAFGMSVQERGRELALLRAVGATPGQVGRMLAREALGVGAAGGLAGVLAGLAFSAAIPRLVGNRIEVPFATLTIPWFAIALIFIGTVLLTLLGGWPAARRSGRMPPLAAMRPLTVTNDHVSGRRTVAGTFALGTLAAVLFGWGWKADTSLSFFLGMRNVQRDKVRSSRPAVILVIGTSLLVAVVSFLATERDDTEANIARQFPAQGWIGGPWAPPGGYGDDLIAAIEAIDGVTSVVPVGREVEADLVGYDIGRLDPEYRRIVERRRESPERLTIQTVDLELLASIADFGRVEGDLQGGIVLTRTVARRFGIILGDVLTVQPTNGSPAETLTVTALVDVLPQLHNLVADERFFPHLYAPGEKYKVSFIDFDESADRDVIAAEVRSLLAAGYAAFSYSDFDEWKARWRHEFVEMMAMVVGLGVLLLLISAAGLVNTMAANLHERRAELAALYAIGATPAQLVRIVRAEAVTIGTAGSVLGVGTGVLMVFALWGRAIPEGLVMRIPGAIVVAGLLAGPIVAAAAATMLTGSVVE